MSSWRGGSRRVLFAAWAAALAVGVRAGDPTPETDPGPPPFVFENELPKHTGDYVREQIAWEAHPGIRDVRDIFPHPVRALQAFVTAAAGLFRTDDGGRTWVPLEAFSGDRVGAIAEVAFRPGFPDVLYVGTERSGLWVSEDAGGTASRLGGKDTGMCSDAVATVALYPADPTFRTIVAGHGREPGLSRSDDGGKTWTPLYPTRCIHRVACGAPGRRELYLLASHRNAPEVMGFYLLASLGDYPRELLADILATDIAVREDGEHEACLTTVDGGVVRVTRDGGQIDRIAPSSVEWAGVAYSWGQHADSSSLWLYEPGELGVIVSRDGLQTYLGQNTGLYKGGLVREGARLRMNAGATVLYAGVNGILYTGRNAAPFRVEDVAASPCVFVIEEAVFDYRRWEAVRRSLETLRQTRNVAPHLDGLLDELGRLQAAVPDAEITLTAKVACPAGTVPAAVTADLSRVGGSHRTAMADDGEHGDGAAGDGVYGAVFTLDRGALRRRDRDWRSSFPGRLGLTVSAIGPGERPAGAVAALGVYLRPDTFTFYSEREDVQPGQDATGEVKAEIVNDPESAFRGDHFYRLETGAGPWEIPLGRIYSVHNVTGYYALSFVIRADPAGADDIRVALRDNPAYTFPTTTGPLPVVEGKFLAGVGGGGIPADRYGRVTIPVASLLAGNPGFLPDRVSWLVLSGNGTARRSYSLDDVRFYLTRDELERAVKEDAK